MTKYPCDILQNIWVTFWVDQNVNKKWIFETILDYMKSIVILISMKYFVDKTKTIVDKTEPNLCSNKINNNNYYYWRAHGTENIMTLIKARMYSIGLNPPTQSI